MKEKEKVRETSNGSRHKPEVRRYPHNLPPDFDTWSNSQNTNYSSSICAHSCSLYFFKDAVHQSLMYNAHAFWNHRNTISFSSISLFLVNYVLIISYK